jgi:hypothetical protein
MATKLPAVEAKAAADIAAHFELSEAGAKLLQPRATPGEFLDALTGAGLFPDAINLLAHGLGRREAVWWACVCVRLAPEVTAPPAAAAALAAAEAWCYRPTEENRRAAHAAAEATKLAEAPGWAAMAAFMSGGSMAPPDIPQAVPPGPFVTAKAVAGAVLMCGVKREPAKAPEKYAKFLAKGVEIANAPPASAQRAG